MAKEYITGLNLKESVISGRPFRLRCSEDYQGLPIPVCGEFGSPALGARPPWLISGTKADSLHDEIVAYVQYMLPTPAENQMRQDLITRFSRLVTAFQPGATIKPIGSFVTGLYLPTSDIDLVVTLPSGHHSPKQYLAYLESKIYSSGFARHIKAILHASVPLLKITDAVTGIEIDLTVGTADEHGVKATKMMADAIKRLDDDGMVTALVMVLKQFLAMRRLGSTYTGGVNSYLLVWMVVAWMELEYPKLQEQILSGEGAKFDEDFEVFGSMSCTSDLDQGVTLIAFLSFYGQHFDYSSTAININPTPSYGRKSYTYIPSRFPYNRHLFSLKDPANTSIDLGQKAYAIKHVESSLFQAYTNLMLAEGVLRKRGTDLWKEGALGRLLGGNYQEFERKRVDTVISGGY